MGVEMMQNVQGAAPVQWPDPTALTPVAPTPAAAPARHVHEPRPIDAPDSAKPYDATRLQAFRPDAPQSPPPIQAPAAVDTDSSSSAPRR